MCSRTNIEIRKTKKNTNNGLDASSCFAAGMLTLYGDGICIVCVTSKQTGVVTCSLIVHHIGMFSRNCLLERGIRAFSSTPQTDPAKRL